LRVIEASDRIAEEAGGGGENFDVLRPCLRRDRRLEVELANGIAEIHGEMVAEGLTRPNPGLTQV